MKWKNKPNANGDIPYKKSLWSRMTSRVSNFGRNLMAMNVNRRLAWIQVAFYLLFLVTNVAMFIAQRSVTINANLIVLLKSFRFLDYFVLFIRLVTMVLGIAQIVYGMQTRFTWGAIAGAAALLQTLPLAFIPLLASIITLILNLWILNFEELR